MSNLALVALIISTACSSGQRSFENAVAVCVAEDAIGVEQAIADHTFEVYLANHGAEFAVCAMRAWSARNAAKVTAPTAPTGK